MLESRIVAHFKEFVRVFVYFGVKEREGISFPFHSKRKMSVHDLDDGE